MNLTQWTDIVYGSLDYELQTLHCSDREHNSAIIHISDDGVVAFCGVKVRQWVAAPFYPNCAQCLANEAMLDDPGDGDES